MRLLLIAHLVVVRRAQHAVPTNVEQNPAVLSSCDEIPKSEILTAPWELSSTLAGFRSRCTWCHHDDDDDDDDDDRV